MSWSLATVAALSSWDAVEAEEERIRIRWTWVLFHIEICQSGDVSSAMRRVEQARKAKGMELVHVDSWGTS